MPTFALLITMRKMQILFGKGCWNPRRKLGETTHFLEIIELQLFRKKMPYTVMYFKAF